MSVDVSKEVSVTVTGGIATVTLNRPPVNVLNIAFMRVLEKALGDPATVRDAGVLAVRAEGKAFCAGVDVADHTAERTEEMLTLFHQIIGRLHALEIPTVALVHASALGGGFELAGACDIVLASEKAGFAVPEITLGVFPPVAMVYLPRAIGVKKAAELIFTGSTLSAAEAERLGLVSAVYPVDEFESRAAEFLNKFSKLSRSSLIQTKKALLEACRQADPAQALAAAETRYLHDLMATADAREGIAAFMEKREPVWSHR